MRHFIRWLRVYTRYRWSRYDVLVRRGAAITLGFLLCVAVLAMTVTCSNNGCETRAVAFWYAAPNEIGDTLAGIAGALAFLWIIVTVMLQSKELSAQRQELRLTRKEAKRTAEAIGEQVKILKDEQRQRWEAYAAREAGLIHSTLINRIISLFSKSVSIRQGDKIISEVMLINHARTKQLNGVKLRSKNLAELIKELAFAATDLADAGNSTTDRIYSKEIYEVVEIIDEYLKLMGQTSPAQKVNFEFNSVLRARNELGECLGGSR